MKAEASEREALWEGRVQAWKDSKLSARKFADSRGLAESTLMYWAKRLRESNQMRLLRLVPKASGPVVPTSSLLTVEVGAARVVIETGFDRKLLADVVDALSRGGR